MRPAEENVILVPAMPMTTDEEEREGHATSGTGSDAGGPSVSGLTSVSPGAWLLRGFDRAQIHPLAAEVVDDLVRRGLPGRYVLGYRDVRGAFRIQHVGYAPSDLHAALKARIGTSKCFKFRLGHLMACHNLVMASTP